MCKHRRFPRKRYHEQTSSPTKAQRSWRATPSESLYAKETPASAKGCGGFLELLMGFGSRLRARSSVALTGLAAARSRSGSDSPPDCHSPPSRRFAPHRGVIHYHSPPNPIYRKKTAPPRGECLLFGAANGIRTHDLVITNDVLYRLSYSSVSNA